MDEVSPLLLFLSFLRFHLLVIVQINVDWLVKVYNLVSATGSNRKYFAIGELGVTQETFYADKMFLTQLNVSHLFSLNFMHIHINFNVTL